MWKSFAGNMALTTSNIQYSVCCQVHCLAENWLNDAVSISFFLELNIASQLICVYYSVFDRLFIGEIFQQIPCSLILSSFPNLIVRDLVFALAIKSKCFDGIELSAPFRKSVFDRHFVFSCICLESISCSNNNFNGNLAIKSCDVCICYLRFYLYWLRACMLFSHTRDTCCASKPWHA